MPRRRSGRLILATVITLAVPTAMLPGGCAPNDHSPDNNAAMYGAEDIPVDFSLAVTVYPPPGPRAAPRGGRGSPQTVTPPERIPARYVLESDRVLRAGVGRGVGPESFPGRTRQLTVAQVRLLWDELSRSGLMAPEHAGSVGAIPPAGFQADSDEADQEAAPTPRCTVAFCADGVRRLIALNESDAGEATRLVRRLAALGWVGQ